MQNTKPSKLTYTYQNWSITVNAQIVFLLMQMKKNSHNPLCKSPDDYIPAKTHPPWIMMIVRYIYICGRHNIYRLWSRTRFIWMQETKSERIRRNAKFIATLKRDSRKNSRIIILATLARARRRVIPRSRKYAPFDMCHARRRAQRSRGHPISRPPSLVRIVRRKSHKLIRSYIYIYLIRAIDIQQFSFHVRGRSFTRQHSTPAGTGRSKVTNHARTAKRS